MTMSEKLRLDDVRRARAERGRSALMFLTDRCPVGCAHCSVGSRRDSPTIANWGIFEQLVAGLCSLDRLQVVGISGGEPFIERRGLVHAVESLTKANKHVVLYTSGVWGSADPPQWLIKVLEAGSVVFLSTDSFHKVSISDETFLYAAKAVVDAKTPLVVPVINSPEERRTVSALLQRAFGKGWEEFIELEYNPPLTYGRGTYVFSKPERRPASLLGICKLMTSPVVRYDGRVTACCNEEVIVGKGPRTLSRYVDTAEDMRNALDGFERAPLLRLLGTVGGDPLLHHDRFHDLNGKSFTSICELCWAMHHRMPPTPSEDGVLSILAELTAGN